MDRVGRAENDGTGKNESFVASPNATAPRAVAVDAGFLYWGHDGAAGPTGNIGRVGLDGSSPAPAFVTTNGSPMGLTLDQAGVYWTQSSMGTDSIGRANLFNGAVTNQSHVANIGASPCGLTTDADKFFWALSGAPGKVMRAHGIFPPFTELPPAGNTSDPCGVAEANFLVYWTNRGDDTIRSVNLTGTTLGPSIALGAGTDPCGVAVDGGHIYWTEPGTDQISRAETDGSNVNAGPDFPIILTPTSFPCGIAVDPTARAEPAQQAFADTPVNSHSDIATLVVVNTSSSTLDPGTVSIVGPDAGDFNVTGNGCTVNVVAVNGTCIVNADFTPTSEGAKTATLRVASNASNSPTEFALSGTATALPTQPPAEPPAEPPANPPAQPGAFARGLTLSYSRRADRFKGALSSAKAECVAGQKVAVYKRHRGSEARVGSDRTDASGRWRVDERDARGTFHAVTEQSTLAAGDTCLAARSAKLKVG